MTKISATKIWVEWREAKEDPDEDPFCDSNAQEDDGEDEDGEDDSNAHDEPDEDEPRSTGSKIEEPEEPTGLKGSNAMTLSRKKTQQKPRDNWI